MKWSLICFTFKSDLNLDDMDILKIGHRAYFSGYKVQRMRSIDDDQHKHDLKKWTNNKEENITISLLNCIHSNDQRTTVLMNYNIVKPFPY